MVEHDLAKVGVASVIRPTRPRSPPNRTRSCVPRPRSRAVGRITPPALSAVMSKQRRTFSAEFKREAAALVLDQGYSHIDACRSLGRPDQRALLAGHHRHRAVHRLDVGQRHHPGPDVANLTITKALLNVIADAKTKVYGDADPALTYQVSGIIRSARPTPPSFPTSPTWAWTRTSPGSRSSTSRTAEDPGAGGSDQPAGAGESDPKKGYRSLDVGPVGDRRGRGVGPVAAAVGGDLGDRIAVAVGELHPAGDPVLPALRRVHDHRWRGAAPDRLRQDEATMLPFADDPEAKKHVEQASRSNKE